MTETCKKCGKETEFYESVYKPIVEIGRLRIEWRTMKQPVCVKCAVKDND